MDLILFEVVSWTRLVIYRQKMLRFFSISASKTNVEVNVHFNIFFRVKDEKKSLHFFFGK